VGMTRLVTVVLLAAGGCGNDYTLSFRMRLLPTCTCPATEISLAAGATIGFQVLEGSTSVGAACLTVDAGAASAEDVLPGILSSPSYDVDGLEPGKTLTFEVNVARPQNNVACGPHPAATAPIILQGSSDAVTLEGDVAPIQIELDCFAACP
jgi:hypothetical protein